MSESTDDPAAFHERLDGAEESLEAAETEGDLDELELLIEDIESDLGEATFPEPEEPEDEEDEPPDPREELEGRIQEINDGIEEQRGPYAEDVTQIVGSVATTIETTEWAEEGKEEVESAVDSFADEIAEVLEIEETSASLPLENLLERLEAFQELIDDAGLDPDEDAEEIAELLEAAQTLEDEIDSATAFGDLPVREQLNRRGFFDVLGHYKDFPPEWSAIKAHEEARNVEMILLAYELLDSNFMEEHCIDALRRLGDERAVEPMMGLARRRDQDAIAVLGKIGSEEPVDMLVDYVDTDSDPALQRASIQALGEIGSEETTEPIAQQLSAEPDSVRSVAARALGMIGDTRAIEPLSNTLADDPSESVRGSAAWALVEIGTETALETVREYAQDGSYLVEAEAQKAMA